MPITIKKVRVENNNKCDKGGGSSITQGEEEENYSIEEVE